MKIKIYTFLIVFYFLISNLFAGQISINSARDIARKLYYEKTKTDFNNIIFSNEYAIKNRNTIVYYIFNLQNAKGFIIIAADDRVSPVLAYSTTSSYNPANMSPAFYTFTQSYKNQITNVIQNNIKSSSEINNLWSKYKQNEKDFINSVSYQVLGSSVAPLLGVIMWDQGLGWNNNCPADVDGPGGHVYAGCVATATSQVMKYYHHPAKGTGSFSYTSANYGVLSANFAASTYDWANMPDASYNNNISQLLYNVGVALKMDYTADGSGAYDQQVKQALANYFDYSPNISYIERADYTDQDWINTIKNELDNARPVIYGGQDTTYGGHCFVCDGYDASDFFHINWGWSGGGDGYFNLSSLCVGKYNFNSDQDAVINIYPSSKNVPVSNFKSDINSITSGNSVHFFDVSSSAPTSWNWYFPGGSPAYSNQQNPVIKYNTPGIYPVSLIASNSKGAGINTVKNGYISVYKQPNNTCIVTTVDTDNVFRLGITNFQLGNINNSSGGAIEDKGYKDFSGIASTTLNPGQTYPLSVIVGPYIKENVNVYIDYNNNGVFTDAGELVYTGTAFTNTITGSFTTPATPTFNTLLRMRVISDYYLNTIGPCISPEYGQAEDYGVYFPSSAKPVADFETSNTTVNAGDKICLIDLSSNSPTSWQWTITPATYTFINGTNANSQNPQLFFNAKGTYTITLQATNASGSGIKTINSYITVNQTAPIADFTTDKTVINTNASVSFSDLSSMAPSSWQWTISPSTITYLNGTNSNSQNPVVKFNNSGNYTITLQSSNSIGSNTITKTEFIHVMVNPSCSTTTVYINNDYGIGIQNVRLASLIWNSGDTRADSIIYGGKGYMDFSSYANTSLLPNTTYSATITVGYFYKEKIKVFIDYNNNGVFTNLGENIYSSPSPEFVHTFSFTTPSSPVTNTYLRMRVVSDYNSVPGSCGNLNYGQAEDYAVFFPAACTSPVVAVTDQTICSGASANLTATGANAYSWSTTATTNSMTVNPTITTTYKVTGTTNGCTGTATATVTVNSLPSIIVNSPGICSGGSATLTAAGGSTYSWSTSATTNPITVSPTTTSTYYVTGTDANSCKNTAQSVVTVASALTVTVNSPVICNGASTTLTATGATTYSWSTSATTNPITVSPTTTTTYKVTGTTSGCTGTATATVTVNSLPTITVNSPGICSGGSATLTAAGGSVYSWSTSQTVNQITVSPTSTSTYYVTGTDAKSCKNTAQSVVTVASSLTVAVNSPSICSGASASLTATGANAYSWSTTATTNSITVNPTITTTYKVTGTTSGCTGTATATVTVNSLPSITVNSPGICSGGSAILTAAGGSVYSWSTSQTVNPITVSPTSTSTYYVTGTDAKSCKNTAQSVVTVASSLTVTVNSPSICSGASASLTATGANVYSWSTTATTNSITVNPTITTTYKVTGTTSGCTGTAMAIVTLYANPTANAGADVTIKNGNSVNLSATGGDAYSWSNGSSTASITVGPTITSTYYVTVINNGCTATDAVVVFVTNNCIANAGPDATICKGSSVSLTGSGGNLYKWSNGAVGATISVNPSVTTTYYLTITTTNGCTSVDNVVVNVGSIIHANAGVDKSICIGQSTILTATGGGTYKWNTGSRLATITVNPTLTTTYVVTVNQSFTCSGTDNVVIFVNNTPATVNAGPDKVICKGQSVTLTATGNGTFSWNTGSTLASITVNPIVLKLYTVTINSEGCTASDAAVVRVNNLPIANAGSDKSVCKGNSVTLSATGGALYKWSTGATSSSISVVPSVTTTYIVTVSTSTACSASDNIIISVNNCKSDLEGIAQNIISGVNIYPVPSNGIFYLEGKNIIAGNINIKVFDILGKCIYDQYYKSSGNTLNNVINLSGNPDGIYMLQIEINNQRIFRKLIIN